MDIYGKVKIDVDNVIYKQEKEIEELKSELDAANEKVGNLAKTLNDHLDMLDKSNDKLKSARETIDFIANLTGGEGDSPVCTVFIRRARQWLKENGE